MKFFIKSAFGGVHVRSEEGDYLFKSRLFSHSSVLLGENKKVVASLHRTSWWRMDFTLTTGQYSYQFKQRFSSSTLSLNDSELEFYTTSGHDFFIGSEAATRIEPEGLTVKKYHVEILKTEHWLALLIATCLELQSSMVTKAG